LSLALQDMAGVIVQVGQQGGLQFDLAWRFIMTRADDILARFSGSKMGGNM